MPRTLIAAILLTATLLQPAAATTSPPAVIRAEYVLSLNGAQVGVIHENFEIRDGGYRAVSETHAVGLFALVQRQPGRVTSSGSVDDEGLRPKSYDAVRGGREERRVLADFDWPARTLTLHHDGRSESVALPPGTQDRLSAMYQFLFLDAERLSGLEFAMTNGRKLDHYRYALGPETAIDTPLGRFEVLHLVRRHRPGETANEIWLARDHRLMPVKMRIVEDDGSRYEQLISRLDMR
jgi:hypothetical protein